jgi:hypothetical protein
MPGFVLMRRRPSWYDFIEAAPIVLVLVVVLVLDIRLATSLVCEARRFPQGPWPMAGSSERPGRLLDLGLAIPGRCAAAVRPSRTTTTRTRTIRAGRCFLP